MASSVSRGNARGSIVGSMLTLTSGYDIAALYPVLTVDRILRHQLSAKRLEQYSLSQHSEESILFWKAVQQYRFTMVPEKAVSLAKHIFDQYLRPNAELEVCINGGTYKIVRAKYANNEIAECFRLAEIEAQIALRTDIFPRFTKTPTYGRLLEELLLSLFCVFSPNATKTGSSSSASSIVSASPSKDPGTAPSNESMAQQMASAASPDGGWPEFVPSCAHWLGNPLGHEVYKAFLFREMPHHLHSLALYNSILVVEEASHTLTDIEWVSQCQIMFRESVLHVEQGKVHFVNPDATVATTTRREPSQISKTFATKELMDETHGLVKRPSFSRDAGTTTVTAVTHFDVPNSANPTTSIVSPAGFTEDSPLTGAIDSSNVSVPCFSSAATLLVTSPGGQPDEEILEPPLRPLLTVSMRRELEQSVLQRDGHQCGRDVFTAAKRYLWRTLDLVFALLQQSDTYFQCDADYHILRKAEHEKRQSEYLKRKPRKTSLLMIPDNSSGPGSSRLSNEPSGQNSHENSRISRESSKPEAPVLHTATAVSMELAQILTDAEMLEAYFKFCRREYSDENIECWKAIEDMRHGMLQGEKLVASASAILVKFINPNSQMEIPVDSFTKVALKKRVDSGDLHYDMYDHVQKIVCEFMRGDSYPRFLKADLYEAIMTTRFKKRGNVGDKKSKVKTATKPESVSENPSPSNTSCGCFGP